VDGAIVQQSLALTVTNSAQSRVNYNFIAPATAGSHLVTVRYPGDATHSPSVATNSVLIGNVKASGGFSIAANNLTIANGSTGSTQITVTPTGGYNGRVVWSLTSSGNPTACYGIGSPAVNGTSMTTLTIGVGSACNSALPAERGNLRPLIAGASPKDESPSPKHSAPRVIACLLLCSSIVGGRRRTRLPLLLVMILLTMTSMGLTGCGGSSGNSGNGNGGTTPIPAATTYTITLRGMDSVNTSISGSTTFTLTVD
jgi:hypothetical protein